MTSRTVTLTPLQLRRVRDLVADDLHRAETKRERLALPERPGVEVRRLLASPLDARIIAPRDLLDALDGAPAIGSR